MKRIIRTVVVVSLVGLVGVAAYCGWSQRSGNFATVVADEVFRSNQPTAERLAAYQAEHGIRSVLNLRGASPRDDWYLQEKAAAEALGLQMIDFRMSASTELERAEFEQLVAIMREAPKPMLIHCRSGTDRTGLASVIYQYVFAGIDEETARRQLSIRFGHVSIPYLSQAWPMDETWEKIEVWSGILDSETRRLPTPSITLVELAGMGGIWL